MKGHPIRLRAVAGGPLPITTSGARNWMRFQSSLNETVGSYPFGPRYLGESDGGLSRRLGGEAR